MANAVSWSERRRSLDSTPLVNLLAYAPPVALVVLGFALAFWAIYWDFRRQSLEFHERRLMIERGLTPPPYVHKRVAIFDHRVNLAMGMFLTFLGIGLALAAFVPGPLPGDDAPNLKWNFLVGAAITGVLGLGQVTYYYVGRRDAAPPSRRED